jgi:hemolysin activation/secretion protein
MMHSATSNKQNFIKYARVFILAWILCTGYSHAGLETSESEELRNRAKQEALEREGTGKLQAGLNLAIDNLFNINDLFNIGISSDGDNNTDQRGTQGNNIYYSIHYGNWTHSLSANESQYHQRVVGTYQTFLSSGIELKTAYMFHRDQRSKSSVQFRTGRRWEVGQRSVSLPAPQDTSQGVGK